MLTVAGTPGDFGYKWFFIPEKIKKMDNGYKNLYNIEIVTDKNSKQIEFKTSG